MAVPVENQQVAPVGAVDASLEPRRKSRRLPVFVMRRGCQTSCVQRVSDHCLSVDAWRWSVGSAKGGCQTSCLQQVSGHSLSFGAWGLGCLIRREVRSRTIAACGKSGTVVNRARFRPLARPCCVRFALGHFEAQHRRRHAGMRAEKKNGTRIHAKHYLILYSEDGSRRIVRDGTGSSSINVSATSRSCNCCSRL